MICLDIWLPPTWFFRGDMSSFDPILALSSDHLFFFFFSSRRRHTRSDRDWSSDVCSSDLIFGYDLDFYTDPRKGDTFRIILEKKKYAKGQTAGYGNILAAEYENAGRKYQA